MNAETVLLWLIGFTAPAQNMFVLLYGFGSPWWRSLLGRALFTKALGLALVLDLALLFHVCGDDYPYRDALRVAVFAVIAVGSWLQLFALVKERRRAQLSPSQDRNIL